MGEAIDWRDAKYDETFEEELRGLERRRARDPDCSVADIEATLRHLRTLDGSDHGGRGSVQEIYMAASIAAHELFISRWKAELGGA